MSFELAAGTLLNSRYQIKKVVVFNEEGGTYTAKDLKVTDKSWIIDEMIPAASLDENQLEQRRVAFNEVAEQIMQFDHPGLGHLIDHFSENGREYVVREDVQGVNLQQLTDMSVSALPEKQVLEWAMQMADVLGYLMNRPKPFVYPLLQPVNVILTSDEKLKLVGYGLDAFFKRAEPPTFFTDDTGDVPIAPMLVTLGQTLAFLVTKDKDKQTARSLPANANASAGLARIINKLLAADTAKAYGSFEEVRQELDLVLHPPAVAAKKTPTASKGKEASKVDWSLYQDRAIEALNAVLAQKPAFLVTEAVVLVALIVGLWMMTRASYTYTKNGSVAYLATSDNNLLTYSLTANKQVDKQPVEAQIGDLACDPSGRWLFVSDSRSNRVLRYDTQTNKMPENGGTIKTDNGPSRMAVDDSGKRLYVVHESTNNVSRINLNREPPTTDNIIAVGNGPRAVALAPATKFLCSANFKDQSVSIVDPETNKILGTVSLTSAPTALAVSPDAQTIWAACSGDIISVVDVASNSVKSTITEVKGKGLDAIAFAPDGTKVYVSCQQTNNLTVLDPGTMKVLKTIPTAPGPLRMTFTPYGDVLWVTCASGNVTQVNTNSDTASSSGLQIPGVAAAEAMCK
jgi:YVTN family beta-propeller protein